MRIAVIADVLEIYFVSRDHPQVAHDRTIEEVEVITKSVPVTTIPPVSKRTWSLGQRPRTLLSTSGP